MSPSPSPDSPPIISDNAENHLQPFFVLHKAIPKKRERKQPTPAKTRRKIDLSPASSKSVESRDEEGDDHRYEQLRIEAFDLIWSKIEAAIKDVLRRINTDLFSDVHRWVAESFNAIKSSTTFNISDVKRPYPMETDKISKQLFTAFILTRNVEFVDDLLTFGELSAHLKSHDFHVANLSSADFNVKNGVGGCLRSLLRQLIMVTVDTADIAILAAWYSEAENYDIPIVVIIDDTERCNGTILAEFIIMLSEWVVKIPFILVMGVATTVDAPQKLLRSKALQHLQTCLFTLGSPLEKMDAIIEGVLVKSNFGFYFGYKVAVFLRNYFLRHDGTITSFIRALKIACVKHFAMEPLSFLGKGIFDEDSQGFWNDKCSLLSEAMLNYAFDLPSCKREILSERTSDILAQGLSKLERLQKNWSSVVMCLYEAGKFHKIQLLDIFCEVLDPDFLELRASDYISGEGKNFAKTSSTNDRLLDGENFTLKKGTFTAQAVHKIRDLPMASLFQLLKIWEKHTEKMAEINHKVKELQLALKVEDDVKSLKRKDPGVQGMSMSRSRLNVVKRSAANDEAALLAQNMVRDYLTPVECTAFHEVVCFKNADILQSALIGDPRRTIQVDLLQSHTYLHCSCCCKGGNGLLPSMHDTSIMYNLAQEHGDLINLHDWYQSFKQTLSSNTKSKHKKQQSPVSKKKKATHVPAGIDEASIQARFCRAVTELQITGLLRMPSKRRPDYVQRIAFGL
ncbi:hypothetical protein MRB53_022234 [Persea americana]|uniref:Uncharacterized protein n=1 Tax=Persea americana TaxID=3435 RepID=A0ACC2L6V2_PERAE|nr:hypothetical protein MRB53_022234 [Persea americana]